MCCYSRQLCWNMLNFLKGSERIRDCMIISIGYTIIPRESTFIYLGNTNGRGYMLLFKATMPDYFEHNSRK